MFLIVSILRTCNVTKRFGGVTAVNSCSFEMKENSIYGLLGPNGSGKTTLLNVISGFYKPDEGNVYFKDEDITGIKPYNVALKGIGRVFQVPRIFRKMSVLENMIVPTLQLEKKEEISVKKALTLLDSVGLANLQNEFAENLSGGQQKLLELIRMSMAEPQLYLLDEPFAGVHPEMKEKIIKFIKEEYDRGKAFVLVSHDIKSVMNCCGHIMVLNYGILIAEGKPKFIQCDEKVIEAYLGV
jgi:branched-chain amino acid transport system ATP-binding protein